MSYDTEGLSQTLSEQLSVRDKDEGIVLQVALIATVYFEAPYRREAREAVVACCEDYVQNWGEYLRWAVNPDTGRMERFGSGKGSNPRTWLPTLGEDESFDVIYHGAEHTRGASAFSLSAFGQVRRPRLQLGHLRVSFPLLAFVGRSGSLPDVLLGICETLKPVSGYGGIGVIESPYGPLGAEYEPIVYQWAQRFPGLEIDYPISHGLWLCKGREGKRDGIKGGNWLTVLSNRYVEELGGADKIEADLKALDSRFVIRRYDGGALVQAGPHPQLGDTARDIWPPLYVSVNKYVKPIRITHHRPFHHPGPERFDQERSEAWLRRFDDR